MFTKINYYQNRGSITKGAKSCRLSYLKNITFLKLKFPVQVPTAVKLVNDVVCHQICNKRRIYEFKLSGFYKVKFYSHAIGTTCWQESYTSFYSQIVGGVGAPTIRSWHRLPRIVGGGGGCVGAASAALCIKQLGHQNYTDVTIVIGRCHEIEYPQNRVSNRINHFYPPFSPPHVKSHPIDKKITGITRKV